MANQYDVQQNNIDRRRSLLDALTQQSLTPQRGQMAGQVYVGPGLLDALARPLAALAAGYGNQSLNQDELANSQARKQGMQDDLASLQGKTGSDFSTAALGSDNTLIQQVGEKSLLNAMAPKKPESFKLQTVAGPDGKPSFAQVGDYGTIKPVSGVNPYEAPQFVGGEAVIPSQAVPGQLYGRDPAPRVNNQISVTPQFMQGVEEKQMSKDIADVHKTRYANALQVLDSSQDTQDMLNQIQQLEGLPRLSGTGADLALKAARIGSIFGVQMPEKVVNSAQLDSIVKTQLLQFIRQGGRGITNEEGERFLEAHPNITQDPESAKALRIMLQNASDRSVRRAKLTVQQIENRNGPDIKPVTAMTPPGLPDKPVIGSGGSQQIQTEDDYNNLPSGATFTDPNGQLRRKP